MVGKENEERREGDRVKHPHQPLSAAIAKVSKCDSSICG